jgi:hypothetical protein
MIFFIEGKDTEINAALNDLRAALPLDTKQVSLKTDDISDCAEYVVAEISDVKACIQSGISPNRIIGIGYSRSSYIDNPNTNGLHRHYTTSRKYHPDATELPFGYSSANKVKELKYPKTIGIVADFTPPRLSDLDLYEYLYNPQSDNAKYDILVYASDDDRYSRSIRHAIASGIPIIGYTSIPLIGELVERGLAFALDKEDDFENAITNTVSYIGSNIQWQLINSVDLFKYAGDFMNWDRWIYELERL